MNEKPEITEQPPYKFWYPHVLAALHGLGGKAKTRDAVQKTLDFFDISNDVMSITETDKKSGYERPTIVQNVNLARNYLYFAGYIDNSEYGVWKLTSKAKKEIKGILDAHEQIKNALIKKENIQDILKDENNVIFINKVNKEYKNPSKADEQKILKQSDEEGQKISEEISQTQKELNIIKKIDAYRFEILCLKIFNALGYEDVEGTPQSWDSGYDGVGYLTFGVVNFKVIFQSKRYDKFNISGKEIDEFIGTINRIGADRGVFFTTSDFTRDAKKRADRHGSKLNLINGEKLIKLLRKHQIGYSKNGEEFIINEEFFNKF